MCSIDDIELTIKDVHEVWSVSENGQLSSLIETYSMESYAAYYYCKGCDKDWVINSVQTQEQAWKLVKEHFSDN